MNIEEEINENRVVPSMICVEYPGLVQNPDRMIDTLGGIDELSRTFLSEKKRLQLKFRPDNVFAKPAFGDKQNSTGMLIKVRIRKSRTHPEKLPEVVSKEIVATVGTTYKFNSMCDYQFLPIHKNSSTGEATCIYDEIVPQGIIESSWFNRKNVPYFLPPTVFSRTDTVQQRLLKNETVDENDERFVKVTRKNRSKYGKIVQFNLVDPVPTKPHQAAPELLKTKMIEQEQYDLVYQLFQKRPIWTRTALLPEVGIDERRLSYILTSVSYFYLTGPWRTTYVRFGYDPRKDFHSRYYQILDYRVRQSGGFKNSVLSKNQKSTQKITSVKTSARSEEPGTSDEAERKLSRKHIFDENTVPTARVVFYQFCDVNVPKIQDMLYKIPTVISGATCNEKRGWLPPGFIDQCRNIMSEIAQKNLKNEFRKERDESMEASENFDDFDDEETVGFPDLEEDDDMDDEDTSKMDLN